jgi:hypothetical protein
MELDFRSQFMIASRREGFYKEAEVIILCNDFFYNWFVPMMCSDFQNQQLWKDISKYEDNESFLKLKAYINSK